VSSALFFLLVRSVRGRAVRMLRRLREPKYLFGFLIGAGWTLFWVSSLLRGRFGSGGMDVSWGMDPETVGAMAGEVGQVLQLVAALFMTIGFTIWWAIPLGRSSLEFSEAELHMLLPAPVPRRSLIQYGILRSQPPIMIGAAIVSFMSGGTSALGLILRFFGVWLMFSAWDLHGKARGLWLARLSELPPAVAWRKRLILWGVLLTIWILLLFAVGNILIGVLDAPLPTGDPSDMVREVLTRHLGPAWNGLLGWLLAPFIWLTRPFFVGFFELSAASVLAAWSVPLVALVLHNEWVVRSQARFEEAALDHARRQNRKLDPAAKFWKTSARSRRWRPFELAASGAPEMAIVWKNLMISNRMPLRWLIGAGLVAVAIFLALAATSLVPAWFAVVLQAIGGIMMFVAPLLSARSLRHDLRTDLLKIEVIRSWPLPGWRLFLAEISVPVLLAMLQVILGALVYIGVDLLIVSGLLDVTGGTTAFLAEVLNLPPALAAPVLLASLLPLSLVLAALATSVENLAALTFPSWVQLGLRKAQAATKAGQNILVFFVLSLVIMAGVAPGVLLVGGILAVQILFWGIPLSGWELPFLGLAGAAPIGAVVAALVRAGGALWDRLDPSEEILSGGQA
jgi:hypothetical protein